MALADIIGGLKGPPTLVESLDKYLDEYEEKPRTGWHPSSFAGMCPRANVIAKLTKSDGREPIDPKLQRIFDTGHALHDWYQNKYFGPMKILWGPWECQVCREVAWGFMPDQCTCGSKKLVYKEVPIRAKLPDCTEPLNGRSDGLIILAGTWYVLEIKTINSNAFRYLRQPRDNHILQAQIYGFLIQEKHVDGVPFGVKLPNPVGIKFLYIAKDTSELQEFPADIDPNIGKRECMLPVIVERALAKGELPPRSVDCPNASSARAKKCAMKNHCFGQWTYEDLKKIGVGKMALERS